MVDKEDGTLIKPRLIGLDSKFKQLNAIWDYFAGTGNSTQADIGLLNVLAVGSLINDKVPLGKPLSVMNVASSGAGKSVISDKLYRLINNIPKKERLIPNEIPPEDRKLVFMGHDITSNSIIERYKNGELLDNKCMLFTDLTACINSKGKNTKERLYSFFTTSLSDGHYSYSDRMTAHEDTFFYARTSVISNIAYKDYVDNFVRTAQKMTLINRFGLLYHHISPEEHFDMALEIGFYPVERPIIDFKEPLLGYREVKRAVAKYLRARRLNYSEELDTTSRFINKMTGLMCGVLVYEQIESVSELPYFLIDLFVSYSKDTLSTKAQILDLLRKDKPIKEICSELEITLSYAYKLIKHLHEDNLLEGLKNVPIYFEKVDSVPESGHTPL